MSIKLEHIEAAKQYICGLDLIGKKEQTILLTGQNSLIKAEAIIAVIRNCDIIFNPCVGQVGAGDRSIVNFTVPDDILKKVREALGVVEPKANEDLKPEKPRQRGRLPSPRGDDPTAGSERF